MGIGVTDTAPIDTVIFAAFGCVGKERRIIGLACPSSRDQGLS